MSKLRVTLTLDGGLVGRVDEAAWLARLSRSAWVELRLEDALLRGQKPNPGLPEDYLQRVGTADACVAEDGKPTWSEPVREPFEGAP